MNKTRLEKHEYLQEKLTDAQLAQQPNGSTPLPYGIGAHDVLMESLRRLKLSVDSFNKWSNIYSFAIIFLTIIMLLRMLSFI